MSRWKIAAILVLLVPILVLGAGGVLIGRKFGWPFAWRFVVGIWHEGSPAE